MMIWTGIRLCSCNRNDL